jgi:hypothetical protein
VVRPVVPEAAFVPPVVPDGLRLRPLVRASRDAARGQKPDTFGHVAVFPQAGRAALRATLAGLDVAETPRVEAELFMVRVKEWSRKLGVPVERPGGSRYSREDTRAEGTGRLEFRLEESREPWPRLK